MIFFIMFSVLALVLTILTNSTNISLNLPNPLTQVVFTTSGPVNLFLLAAMIIFSLELSNSVFNCRSRAEYYDAVGLYAVILLSTFSIFVMALSFTTLLDNLPGIKALAALVFYIIGLASAYFNDKLPLGNKVLYFVISGVMILYAFSSLWSIKCPSQFSSTIMNPFLFTITSTWPKKPFAFKNIFNELSGDNALRRKA